MYVLQYSYPVLTSVVIDIHRWHWNKCLWFMYLGLISNVSPSWWYFLVKIYSIIVTHMVNSLQQKSCVQYFQCAPIWIELLFLGFSFFIFPSIMRFQDSQWHGTGWAHGFIVSEHHYSPMIPCVSYAWKLQRKQHISLRKLRIPKVSLSKSALLSD